jgi:hypothetical protein
VSLADGIREIRDAVSSGAVGDYSESRYSNIKALTDGGAADVLSRGTSQTRLDSLAAGA